MITLSRKSVVFQHSFTINYLVRSSITERLDQYNYIRKCILSCHYAPHAQYVKNTQQIVGLDITPKNVHD